VRPAKDRLFKRTSGSINKNHWKILELDENMVITWDKTLEMDENMVITWDKDMG